MNIVLFETAEAERPLPRSDTRAKHVTEVLRCGEGDSFDAGLVDGPRGKATIVAIDDAALRLSFSWGEEPPSLDPVTLIAGLPRPQTARKILEQATALGVEAMHFVATERGEVSYGKSRLWSTEEWRRHLVEGASQAFTTRLPDVTSGRALAEVLGELPTVSSRVALDNYEAAVPLSPLSVAPPVVLALGPERGWSAGERELLREWGFEMVHLGERVLRVETACVAAIALVKSKLGLM